MEKASSVKTASAVLSRAISPLVDLHALYNSSSAMDDNIATDVSTPGSTEQDSSRSHTSANLTDSPEARSEDIITVGQVMMFVDPPQVPVPRPQPLLPTTSSTGRTKVRSG